MLRMPTATSRALRASCSALARSGSARGGLTSRTAAVGLCRPSFRSSDHLLLEFLNLLISFLLILEFAANFWGHLQ